MRIAVPKETQNGETRVAVTPDVVKRLLRDGHEIRIESTAGDIAGAPDAHYEAAGATVGDRASILDGADLVALVNPPTPEEVGTLPEGVTLVSLLWPHANLDTVRALIGRNVTSFAMELVPRITRAQSMDCLSSMSTVAGYRAGLLAAQHLGKFFPMLMTAAGTIAPARVVVLGAGVAGLQAIATCRRLGAIVEAYDVRAEAREQAKSLGANAISGIILVGAILVASQTQSTLGTILGVFGVLLASINVVGGFLVTDRMLRMFKKKKSPKEGEA